MSDDLEPLSPEEAVEWYLEHREPELSEKSMMNHKYRLDTFVDFCEERGITNLNDLTGRDLHRYRKWRRKQDISVMTLRSNLATLRVFLQFCAAIDAVESGMRERVVLPEVPAEDQARDVKLDEDRANAILDYMDRFAYASRDHVVIGILWHTGIRLGSLRAFDVEDYDRNDRVLKLEHRPETGTPLKNGSAANRSIAVGEYYAGVLNDYLDVHRHNVEDSHGRRPLITSREGRLSETSVRSAVYKMTQPCLITECPHDREPETCEATAHGHESECPSSRSPHGIRRGAITRFLRDGVPERVVSDRMNVSHDVLDRHYDRRTDREKMDLRREFFEDDEP